MSAQQAPTSGGHGAPTGWKRRPRGRDQTPTYILTHPHLHPHTNTFHPNISGKRGTDLQARRVAESQRGADGARAGWKRWARRSNPTHTHTHTRGEMWVLREGSRRRDMDRTTRNPGGIRRMAPAGGIGRHEPTAVKAKGATLPKRFTARATTIVITSRKHPHFPPPKHQPHFHTHTQTHADEVREEELKKKPLACRAQTPGQAACSAAAAPLETE